MVASESEEARAEMVGWREHTPFLKHESKGDGLHIWTYLARA